MIPASLCAVKHLYLHWDVSGAESMVCDDDGNVIQGMSHKRKEIKIRGHQSVGQDISLFIQVSCTGKSFFWSLG